MLDISKLIPIMLACAWISSAHAQAQEEVQARWVADDLATYVRSGPTNEYRIVGSLTSGERVTVIQTQGSYTQVRDESGDEVWIESADLQEERSLAERVPDLKERVESLNARLEHLNAEWKRRLAIMTETLEHRETRIDELERRNARLDDQASQSRERVRALQARLDTQEEDLLMRYFMYGGGVAGAGLLVGLLVPHVPRRRKRDRWF